MRVLIDARKVLDGGIGTYLTSLINGLVSLIPSPQIEVLVSNKKEAEKLPKEVVIQLFNAPLYSWKELVFLRKLVVPTKYDLFHSPHYPLGFFLKSPSVVTVHDIFHLSHPQKSWYPLYAGPIFYHSLLKASKIIAVSESTKDALIATFRKVIDEKKLNKKIRVIPNALPGWATESLDQKKEVLHNAPFAALFSNNKPHKGMHRLLEAYTLYRMKSSRPRGLVIAGYGAEEMKATLKSSPQGRGIEVLGALSPEELISFYLSAHALVVSSSCEGFCIPVIEAHAFKTPVISTPIPAVKELLSDSDRIADDFSPEALTKALLSLDYLSSIPWQGDLSHYSIQKMTEATFEVYKEASFSSQNNV